MVRRVFLYVLFRGLAVRREHIDWSVLRTALIIFIVAITVSAAIGVSGYYFRASMQQEYRSAQANFNQISSRYLKVDDQELLISNYYPAFLELYQRGVIGGERRLDWLESLQEVTDNLEIPDLRYEIESQQQNDPGWPVNTGRYEIYSSNMKINMDMLHEVDLLRLIDRLEQRNTGLFSVSDCELNRRTADINLAADSPNVTASCNLKWYSLRLGSGKEIEI